MRWPGEATCYWAAISRPQHIQLRFHHLATSGCGKGTWRPGYPQPKVHKPSNHPNKPVPSWTPAPALVVGVPPIGSHCPQVVQVAGSYSKVRSPTVGGRVVLPTQHLLEFWAQKLSKFRKQRFSFWFWGRAEKSSHFLSSNSRQNLSKKDWQSNRAWSFALLSLHIEDLGPNLWFFRRLSPKKPSLWRLLTSNSRPTLFPKNLHCIWIIIHLTIYYFSWHFFQYNQGDF